MKKIEMALGIFVEIAQDHYDAAFKTVTARVAPVGE